MIAEHITDLIGNTPLLRIPETVHGIPRLRLFAKLELMNPFGSVKDRIAKRILGGRIEELAASQRRLVENSSGNTAKAMAVLAGMYQIPFRLVSAMIKLDETRDILRLLGVDIEEVAGASECFDPNDPNDPNHIIEREVAASQGRMFFTSQFTNRENPEAHYSTTGSEIVTDLGHVDYFCAGLGTTGSTLGIIKRLREVNPGLVSVGITATKDDFIPGIRTIDQVKGAGFFDPQAYSDFATVTSARALDGMLTLIRRCGLLCGPSSGANFSACLEYLKKALEGSDGEVTAVFIACDRVEWYLSYIRQRRPELFGGKPRLEALVNLPPEVVRRAPTVMVADAPAWIEARRPLVIDTRSAVAFELGSIEGAINIPVEQLRPLVERRIPFCPPSIPVLLVCPIGEQSKLFAAQLVRYGVDAYSLEGGLQAWRGYGHLMTPDWLTPSTA